MRRPRETKLDFLPAHRPHILESEEISGALVEEAQKWLLEALLPHRRVLQGRFSRLVARFEHGRDDVFQIHEAKVMWRLMRFLERERLTWPARIPNQGDARWLGVHPRLGEAIMSVTALAIAGDRGLEIVTNEPRVHTALDEADRSAIVASLLGHRPEATADHDEPTDVAQIVISHNFDAARLTVEQIIELVGDGKDLRAFRAEVAKLVSAMPSIKNPEEKAARLRKKAEEVIAAWDHRRATLPRFAKKLMGTTVDEEGLELSKTVVPALFKGGAMLAMIAAAPGLAIGLVWRGISGYLGLRKREQTGPYRYLTKLQKSGVGMAVHGAPRRRRRE